MNDLSWQVGGSAARPRAARRRRGARGARRGGAAGPGVPLRRLGARRWKKEGTDVIVGCFLQLRQLAQVWYIFPGALLYFIHVCKNM